MLLLSMELRVCKNFRTIMDKRINDPSEVLKKGDEVNVKVLGIDEQKQK